MVSYKLQDKIIIKDKNNNLENIMYILRMMNIIILQDYGLKEMILMENLLPLNKFSKTYMLNIKIKQ